MDAQSMENIQRQKRVFVMNQKLFYINVLIVVLVIVYGCSNRDHTYYKTNDTHFSGKETGLNHLLPRSAFEKKILSLDPKHITEKDVSEVLSRSPAPRIINLHGSIPLITMKSFSKFLILMGYPEAKVRNPNSGSYSYSSFEGSKKLAGMVAWYYEKEGMMPILIGHSQGGMLVIKALHELAGVFNENIPVFNLVTEKAEDRYTIMDPIADVERPVVGLRVGYAAAIGTGTLMRLILGQWDMLPRLRKIPDTVIEFTGFHIQYDFIGSFFFPFGKANRYYPLGSSIVRNVKLPSHYNHITIPLTEHLAKNDVIKDWINHYVPGKEEPELKRSFAVNSDNILFAAELWYSIKKYWCVELQQLIHATRKKKDLR